MAQLDTLEQPRERAPAAPGTRPVVAIVTDAIGPYHRGGKEQRYQAIIPRLAERLDVHVYTMHWWSGPRTVTRDGATYHAICGHRPLYQGGRRSVAQALVFALSCLKLLWARFDVLEADHVPYLQLFVLKFVAAIRGRRLVVSWNEVWDRRQWRAYLGPAGTLAWRVERLAMRLPDCIIAISPETGERLRARVRDKPVIVAAPGIDLDEAQQVAPAEDAVDIVSVGRLLPHKRFDLLLDCLALLADRGLPLRCRIIGDGPQRQELESQVRRLGIEDQVEFRAGVPSDELLSYVKASRLFVFPSEREGFGIAVLEAIACGIPVITTSAPHNLAQHLVSRSARGIVCAPAVSALADAVETALKAAPAPTAGVLGETTSLVDDWIREYDWGTVAATIALALAPTLAENGSAAGAGEGSDDPPRLDPAPVVEAELDDVPRELELPPGHEAGLQTPELDPPAEDHDRLPAEAAASVAPLAFTSERLAELPEAPTEVLEPPLEDTARRPAVALGDLAISLLGVIAIAGLAHVRGAWIVQAAELVLLLSIPGFLLLRAAGASAIAVRRFPVYIPAASLAVLMAAGLGVDLIGPRVGVSRPLAVWPLTVGICGTSLVLIAIALIRRAPSLLTGVASEIRLQHAWPLVLPVLAWIGAMRLGNGHGDVVAVVAVAVSAAALLLAAVFASRLPVPRLALIVYGAALALMWSFSLRGTFVYGFDIAGEYQTFARILAAGRWHTLHVNDAYGAMLSLTVLPSTLSVLTGATPLVIFKAVYPALFALLPVALLYFVSRLVSRRFAFIAVLFVVVQDYTFQQLPAIARQEIGLVLFAALAFAMLDARLRRGTRITLLVVFAVGVVFSHYGTAYYTVALFGGGLGLEVLRRSVLRLRARRRPVLPTANAALVPLLVALVVTSGGAAIWYGPVTDSAQNLSQFFDDIGNQGLNLLPTAGNRGVVAAYVSGNVTAEVNGAKFQQLTSQDYRDNHRFRYVRPIPQAYLPQYQLQRTQSPNPAIRSQPATKALDVERELITQLAILLSAIGTLLLWLRQRTPSDLRLIGAIGVGAVGILAAVRFSGTIANDYNQTRAFLQAMVPLSVCLAWMLEQIVADRRFPSPLRVATPALLALALGGVLLTTSGLRGKIIGGVIPANLSSHGDDSDRFLVTAPEVAAAKWVYGAAPWPDLIFADRYGALRLKGLTGRPRVFDGLTPKTIDHNSWVYADRSNFAGGKARGQVNSSYAIYAWPRLIDDYWNLVYSNGTAAVYARTPTP